MQLYYANVGLEVICFAYNKNTKNPAKAEDPPKAAQNPPHSTFEPLNPFVVKIPRSRLHYQLSIVHYQLNRASSLIPSSTQHFSVKSPPNQQLHGETPPEFSCVSSDSWLNPRVFHRFLLIFHQFLVVFTPK